DSKHVRNYVISVTTTKDAVQFFLQFVPGSNPQRTHASQILSDQSMNNGLDILSCMHIHIHIHVLISISSGAQLLLPSFYFQFLPQPNKTKIWRN
ncbi:hypothetical protein Gotri_005987, partial [Gossypium trilobum]|nr:hypothetical protein [Gossypium trilobum]